MPPLRVVLDNNVVLSALLFPHGRLNWLRLAWLESVLMPLASLETLSELRRIIRYRKFDLSYNDQDHAMHRYSPWCEMIAIDEPPEIPDCRDPRDRMFLELAVVGQAHALVTGDGDLLELAPVFTIPIITPAELRARLELDC